MMTPFEFATGIGDETITPGRYWVVVNPRQGQKGNAYYKMQRVREIVVIEDKTDDKFRQMGIQDRKSRKLFSPGGTEDRVTLSYNRAGDGWTLLGVFKTKAEAEEGYALLA